MAPSSEQDLLSAAREGDAASLEKLLALHQDRVYRFSMKMCRHPEDAEDVLQDTLLTVARSIRDFRGASSLSTWLFTIVRSVCIKKRRKGKFAPEREESLEQDAPTGRLTHPGKQPDEAALGKEIQLALETAIRTLEPGDREVLLLRDVEGLKASEVSEVVGISVAAVKSRLHRARLRIREIMAPTLGISPTTGEAASTCPDVLALYSKHLEGEISADICAEMERHLETCERCTTTCNSLKQTLSLCQRLPPAPVPASVQTSVRTALREFLGAPS